MRLSARLLIASLAVLAAGSAVGCSQAQGLASAGPHRASPGTVTVSPRSAAATASPRPGATAGPAAGGQIMVVGAPRGVMAKAGILADADTGQVLWAKSADAERPIASITKVMTAYLVLKDTDDLDRTVAVPGGVLNYVWKYGASSDGLHAGEVLTVRELLYGLLLESGADAAYTLASAYGPGLGPFVARMNSAARMLGLARTHFTSPDGLPYPTGTSTYSTPADMLTLGEVAMRSPVFREIVDTRFYVLKKGDGHTAHWWGNSNELIGSYPGAVGIKTGYTVVAGHCLLFEAVRSGRPLIGVVLGSPPTGPAAGAKDAARLLNWAFALKQTLP